MSKAAPSARGLFRATGKKSKPVVQRQLDGSYERVDNLEREKDDFYPTPPEPTRALLHAEIGRLRDFRSIAEPAAGDGAMVREMEALGLNVFASDMIDRGCGAVIKNFYDFTHETFPSYAIVTNPPFSECGWGNGKARWLKHALETLQVEYMALLMNWGWPGAGGMKHFYAAHPPARVYLMRWKIDFTGQGAPPMLNAWFVWDTKHHGETVLRMLDRKSDARQSTLFSEAAE
ncbi:hypothetical protein [Phyllobacterium endophyticum]|uniref:SAM-dependent methyltransferase n=1 Tax=Phyllobacterium endophyticum TaxID=1149773 RepID=A0A2P7AUL7_9HYPH|nr:hypothetical protein [Phyllobacterium endophyticum]MBB3234410.1 hypothetical protein [Phyllobacterium endophyticum]PSH57924.1 hypothetical protein CU100_09565 [Phyllobacterium endophyticum]TYR44132.1 hypothetical protein FY050_02915 [Phyllobacterium endophyticum]